MKYACIVLPTYNEAENVESIISQIFAVKKKGWSIHILVVDDKSPDGTGDIVKKLQKKYMKLHLMTGDKQGLGVAYTRGFQYVIKKFDMDVIFEMDADHSHPPEDLPKYLEKIEEGYDFIIGSRYIPGGDTPDWGFMRKLISGGGNFFARIVAGLFRIHDCTSGFRAMNTKFVKSLDYEKLGAKGYSFQMNLLYEAVIGGWRVTEVPLVFYDRAKGNSKMRIKDMTEFFFNSFKLRLRTWARFIRFCLVGGSGVIVNMGILALLTELLSITYQISSLFAIESAIIWNFFLNDAWTFKKSTNKSSRLSKFLKFQVISMVGALINWGVLLLLTEFAGIYYLISNLVGIGVAVVWNFLANHLYTWRDEK